METIEISDQKIIVKFEGDERKQHFEVKCEFNPYQQGIRKWDVWDLWIKWESEIFTDPKTAAKSYFTHLICSKAQAYCQIGNGK